MQASPVCSRQLHTQRQSCLFTWQVLSKLVNCTIHKRCIAAPVVLQHNARGSGTSSMQGWAAIGSTACLAQGTPEMCVIVDDRNVVVGCASRAETVSQRLLGRGAYVLVFNAAGELFVSRRSITKDCYPGCWDVTISGVVNWGEEYLDTAVRELEEEVSVPQEHSRSSLQDLFVFPYQDDVCHVFGCAFKLAWDGKMQFADAEVESGRFMPLHEVLQQLQMAPEQFTPVGRHILDLYQSWLKQQAKGQEHRHGGVDGQLYPHSAA